MPTEAEYIARVRRRVADSEPPYDYDDVHYEDSLRTALTRVNIDLGESFPSVDVVTSPADYLIELRSLIYMCYQRANENATGYEQGENPTGSLEEVEVPNLRVRHGKMDLDGPKGWLDLAKRFEEEYEDLIELSLADSGPSRPPVSVGYLTRHTMWTGGETMRNLDDEPPAQVLTLTVNGDEVELSWTKWKSARFGFYRVLVSDTPSVEDARAVFSTMDAHENDYTHSPGAGTYYYTLRTFNDNKLYADSTTIEAVV